MLKRTYQRSEVYTFYDLSEHQQKQAISLTDQETAENNSYVLWSDEPLPLSYFMRIENPLFHGQYGLTAFSCYFIRLNETGCYATVVYAHC